MTAMLCPDCLKAARMRRKPKKHIDTLFGLCAGCERKGQLFSKDDYSYYGPRPPVVRVLPEEKRPRQVRDWPAGMRFD